MTFNFITSLFKREAPRPAHRFSLHSGERQTGVKLEEIRRDHVVRYEYACQAIAAHLPRQSAKFGLDLFCGNGYGTAVLATAAQCAICGIDASEEAIAIANQHYSSEHTLFVTKAFPFSLPPNTFDFVVSLESLEHIRESSQFLKEIYASMKPGGILVLSTPNAALWSLEINPNPFHHHHYLRDELLQVLSDSFGDRLKLLDWQGQDIYRFEAGKIAGCLPPQEMGLRSQQEGQILVFTFKKIG